MNPIPRPLSRTGSEGKPWLARREWRERRIVSYGGPRGCFFALALVGFGAPAIALLPVAVRQTLQGDRGGPELLLVAAICSGIVVVVGFMWFRRQRFGDSVCRLETLPGVIGGWFKASVEVTSPYESPPPVQATLVNRKGTRSPVTVWERNYSISPTSFTRTQGDRYLVPVRFPIPHGNYAAWNWVSGEDWSLVITAQRRRMAFLAQFVLPIFETREGPPEEQQPGSEV